MLQLKSKDKFDGMGLLPATYFIRTGGICFIESSADALRSGIHIATAKDEQTAIAIIEALHYKYGVE